MLNIINGIAILAFFKPSSINPCELGSMWGRTHTENRPLYNNNNNNTYDLYSLIIGDSMMLNSSKLITVCSSSERSCSEHVRHFLIESSAKGVRVKGSSQEPYFGK